MRLPDYVRPGDILFDRGTGFISWCIKKITKSEFAHVAMVIDQDTLIEAWPGGVRETKPRYESYEIRTCPDLTDEERQAIVAYARQFLGTPYDYLRIVVLLLELFFHIKNRIFSKGHIICSVFVALSYYFTAHINLRPDKPMRHLTPGDLFFSKPLAAY